MVTLPVSVVGAPIGITVQGRRFDDAGVLGVARLLEDALSEPSSTVRGTIR